MTAEQDVLDSAEAGGKAIRGSILRTAAFVGGLLLGLLAVPFMTRHLGVADYGHYVTVSAIVLTLSGITEAGLNNLGIREYAVREGAAREHLLRNLAGLRFTLSAAGVLLATLLVWVTGAETVIVQGTLIAGVGLLVGLTQQTYAIPLSAQLRLGWVSVLELLKQASLTALIVVLVVAGATLLPFFAASIASAAIALVATVVLVRGTATSLRPSADLAVWRALLKDVLPYALATAVGLLHFRFAVVLLSYIGTDQETGLYSAAFRVIEIGGLAPGLAVSAAFPILARAARDDADRLRFALARLFQVSLLAGAGGALCVAIGAPFIIEVVAGDGFEGAVPVLRILAVAVATAFLVATWSFGLLALREHKALLVANAVAATVTATGVLTLSGPLGPEGAALATVLGELAICAGYVVALHRRSADLTPGFGAVPKAAVALGLGALAALLPAPSVVQAVVAGLVFAAAALALRLVPPELLAAVRRV